jgi:Mg-chelatase subunit ChlD
MPVASLSSRPPRLLLLSVLLGATVAAAAADPFVSPSPRPRTPVPPPVQGEPAPWPGRTWAGPASGAPEAPSARHCARSPVRFEVGEDGRSRPFTQWSESGPQGAVRALSGELALSAAPSVAAPAPRAAPAPGSIAARAKSAAAAVETHAVDARVAEVQAADEPTPAGMVDDNADFGAWTGFLGRHAAIGARALDVSTRVLVDVRDEAGRPVPDAALSLWDGATALPLWARTDAGGRAWVFPSASRQAPRGEFLEVRARVAGREAAAVWRPGQREAVQLRLSGVDVPARARLDLAFLIDATGSMDDEIAKLRTHMRRIAGQIAALPSRPDLCFALVAYRDRGDAFFVRVQDFSADLGAIQSALDGLRAQGGGDYPEAFGEALHVAVHRLSWRGEGTARLLIPVADAPPQLGRGGPWYDEDALGAAARGIKLLPVGASGLDRLGETVMRQLAQFTGGRFVFLTYADPRRPQAGPGRHTAHEVGPYTVESLDELVVRLVAEELARWPRG